jgi:hypothetical protein
LATKELVEAKLKELIARVDEADGDVRDSLAETLPEPKVIGVHIRDLDVHYWTEMAGGGLGPLQHGQHRGPDIRVSLASEDLVQLVDGETSLFSKYLSGHVRIDASVGDLLRLRRLAG